MTSNNNLSKTQREFEAYKFSQQKHINSLGESLPRAQVDKLQEQLNNENQLALRLKRIILQIQNRNGNFHFSSKEIVGLSKEVSTISERLRSIVADADIPSSQLRLPAIPVQTSLETNLQTKIWDQVKVKKVGDRFDIALKPTEGMDLETILEALGHKVNIDLLKTNNVIDLKTELEAQTIAIFDSPGTGSHANELITELGLEQEGTEIAVFAIVGLLYAKDLDENAQLSLDEESLLDQFKKRFVHSGNNSSFGVTILGSGVLSVAYNIYYGRLSGLPSGRVVSELKS